MQRLLRGIHNRLDYNHRCESMFNSHVACRSAGANSVLLGPVNFDQLLLKQKQSIVLRKTVSKAYHRHVAAGGSMDSFALDYTSFYTSEGGCIGSCEIDEMTIKR